MLHLDIDTPGVPLPELLAAAGLPLDLRCGGHGSCGRCTVMLRTGRWIVDGIPVDAPAEVKACRTALVLGPGRVEIPERSLAVRSGEVAAAWIGRALPATSETVIGVDLGTTTVAAVKIHDGQVVAQVGCYNRQSRFGDNVVARINHAAAHLDALQREAAESINQLLQELGMDDVARIAVAGNTVMSCLLHGIDPSSAGVSPFPAPVRCFPVRASREVGLAADVPLLTLPAIAGFVGGDIVAGIDETGLAAREMLIDIGTNCEIVFHTGERLITTAAAAGPAFEGAGIECGCRAVNGAIDHFTAPGQFSVIGGEAPRGVCGSALIDLLAAGRKYAFLNEFGRLQPPAPSLEIAPGLRIHEWDIEQLLKAKAAVAAGIATLENHCGGAAETIYLAGGFARFLNMESAVAIGMLPPRNYRVVGNTSLAGAARLAAEPALLPHLEQLSAEPQDMPLNVFSDFEDNFIDALLLP